MTQNQRLSKDISCRVILDFFRHMKSRGIDISAVFSEDLLRSLHPEVASLEYLSNAGNWIDWNSFASIHNAMCDHVYPTPALRRQFIEDSLGSPGVWVKAFYPLAAAIVHPRMLFRLMEWGGSLNFKNIQFSYEETSPDSSVLRLWLREGEASAPEYFEMVAYTFSLLPTIIGYEPAEVQPETTGFSGTYSIRFPQKKKRLQSLRRAFNIFWAHKEFDQTIEAWEKDRTELQHSSQFLTSILENTPDSVMLVDRESVIHYINRLAEGITVDVVGMKALDFIPADQRDRYRQALAKAYDKHEKDEFEIQAAHDNSWWSCKTALVTTPSSDLRVLVIASDITKKKEAAETIIAARNEAVAASRAKDVFLANMSHEVRTPLSAIIGFSEILRNTSLAPESKKCVDIIFRNGMHLLSLINDILNIARIEADEMLLRKEEFDPAQVIRDVVESQRIKTSSKPLDIETRFDSSVPGAIVADKTHLTQVFNNLVENAVKFTDRGRIDVGISGEGNCLHIQVSDTGRGIPRDAFESVFEPFKQLDMSSSRRYGGSGLGLAIARKLARMHGGDVVLKDSVLNKGSVFVVTFPYERPRFPKVQVIGDAAKIDLSGKRVLVVDDHPDIAMLLTAYLESVNAHVSTVTGGNEALEFENLAHIDLILLDLQMPGLDGYETFRRLKEIGFVGKIFAVSAHAGETERQKCLDAGFDAYVSKPVSRPDLMAKLARHLC